MKKTLLIILLFSISSLSIQLHAGDKKVEIIKEWRSTFSLNEAKNMVIKNDKDWEKLKAKLNIRHKDPEIDFKKNMLIAVFMGQRNSGGYSIRITEINEDKKSLTVKMLRSSPRPNGATLAVITSPYHMVLVKKSDKEVIFK